MYEILPYTKKRAAELGVIIMPSNRKNKKLMVHEPNGSVYHVGDSRYLDYPTYKKIEGPKVAEYRKSLYLQRHKKDSGKAGFYAKHLVW